MKILITGSKGKIGSELVNLFLKKTNYDLILSYRKKKIKNKNKRIFFFKQDLLNPIKKRINVDVIIHCATRDEQTIVKKNEKKEVFDFNLKITRNIQKFANSNKIKSIFFLSTTMVKESSKKKVINENDISRKDLYSKSKFLSEKILCHKKNYFRTICLRLPGVLSFSLPKISSPSINKVEILMKFIALVRKNKNVQIYNPYKKFNNVIDIYEIFHFINMNLKKINESVVVQIAASKPITFIKVLQIIKASLKSSSKILISEKKNHSFLISTQKIKKKFGFIPFSTENILKRHCINIYEKRSKLKFF